MNKQEKLMSLFSEDTQGMFSGKYLDSHSYQMAGKLVHVIVVADNDKVGEAFSKNFLSSEFELNGSLHSEDPAFKRLHS